MEKNNNYHTEMNIKNTMKLRELLSTLPPFCKQFFRGIEDITSSRTKIAYAYDIRVFFEFMHEHNPYCSKMNIVDYPITILDYITREDIEEYMEHCSYYIKDDKEFTNGERGKSRKLASLRSFYNYFFRCEMIKTNAPSLVPMQKMHSKEIIRLDVDEVSILLDQVEAGTSLTKSQQKFHAKTKVRDLALITLLLGTGIRVSECVGIDLSDVDFKNTGIKIRRKGGNETIVYFGNEVELALKEYLHERHRIIPEAGHENAFFLSLQNKRLGVRSVENLVKKYASNVTSLKKITPHKLRSTYGTSLYQETGDIYLVADVLGHKDVNTTRKHYAAIDEERRRKARNVVKLREN